MHSEKWERYSRQILFEPLGEEGQEKLLQSRVAIIGLGALGTVSANSLARAGVGYLKLVDRDFIEYSNLQRQILYDEKDVKSNLPKTIAAVKKLQKINSEIQYEALVEDVNFTNIFSIIEDVDLVIDGTDNLEVRYLINEACVSHGIPWIYGACVASCGITFTIKPGETACLSCLWGGVSISRGETCDTAGILGPVPSITASLQSVEAVKLLAGIDSALNNRAVYFDVWDNSFTTLDVQKRDDCEICGKRNFQFITGKRQTRSTYLCGRDAIQVLPPERMELSLRELRRKLAPLGEVSESPYLLKFKTGSHEMVFFPDGRALIKGTSDEKVARSLYARYLGA